MHSFQILQDRRCLGEHNRPHAGPNALHGEIHTFLETFEIDGARRCNPPDNCGQRGKVSLHVLEFFLEALGIYEC